MQREEAGEHLGQRGRCMVGVVTGPRGAARGTARETARGAARGAARIHPERSGHVIRTHGQQASHLHGQLNPKP